MQPVITIYMYTLVFFISWFIFNFVFILFDQFNLNILLFFLTGIYVDFFSFIAHSLCYCSL